MPLRKAWIPVLAIGTVLAAWSSFASGQSEAPEDVNMGPSDCPEAAAVLAEAGWNAEEELGGPSCPDMAAVQALVEQCPSTDCVVVSPGADETSGLRSVAEQLETSGIPASECPAAAAQYREAGQPVDAFVGRCPTAAEVDTMTAEPPASIQRLRQLRQEAGL